jgi:hypothetical protein
MKTLNVGDKVKVLKYWQGEGVIRTVYGHYSGYAVEMTTGPQVGFGIGGFERDEVEPVSEPGMKILTIKRSKQGTGLKVYGTLLGESGKEYKFAYFRRPNFRGWLCTCENFILSKFAQHKNCKHLKFVRAEVGRYAATIK